MIVAIVEGAVGDDNVGRHHMVSLMMLVLAGFVGSHHKQGELVRGLPYFPVFLHDLLSI